MLHDLLLGYREFKARPGVSAVVVATLALGVAGATTMFAMLGAIGGSMVPVGLDTTRVGRVAWTAFDRSGSRSPLTAREYSVLAARTTGFESLVAWSDDTAVLGEDGPTLSAKRISPAFFRAFRFKLAEGREFRADEHREAGARVAIASERFLRRFPVYGLGKTLRLGTSDYTIVGILPDRYWFPAAGTELWLPMAFSEDGRPRVEPVSVAGLLRSSNDLQQAQSQLAVVTQHLREAGLKDAPGTPNRKLVLITLEQDVSKRMGFGLVGLLGPSIVVLLIACGNVANLLLARAARREREMAVRAALGAGRWRLMRERLAENAWLAAAGGTLGLLVAVGTVRLLRAWVGRAPEARDAATAIVLDGRALIFALAMTAAVPFVFGLVPALVASRPNLQSALHQSPGRRKPRRGPYGGRDLLVIVEVGFAVVLVVCACMFGRFFKELGRVQWGFNPAKVVVLQLAPNSGANASSDSASLVDRVGRALHEVPGVERVAVGAFVAGDPIWRGEAIEFERCAAAPGVLGAATAPVDADFFATFGITVRRGRPIGPEDASGTPPVAVISQRHADRCWPGQDPLGRRVRTRRDPAAAWATVVGVAPDAMTRELFETVQPVYVPLTQGGDVPASVFVRTSGDTERLIGPLRSAVRSIDKAQPLDRVGRLDEQMLAQFSGTPVLLGVIGGFGLFALALAALGLFSVISYMVAERTREFGIRIALGASRANVLRLVVGQVFAIVAVGAGISIVGTLGVTHVAFREMAALAVTDALLWTVVAALLALVGIAASIVPARRATGVQPSVALRAE